ncbi:DUF2461 domain-containing protein [Balneatrix alpica]|uniref:DUF2461 domain-containing protein n=1 Tax=Balneatrix alpica TaxID=75684 RepID=UPI002739F9C7|nr:DUF2461 domain-containing protein [Balneatrix alpica]
MNTLSPELFQFLRELRSNNNKEWFADNKTRYQEQVQQPLCQLMEALQAPLAQFAPEIQVIAKAHNGSLFRIYRDTRFSNDKTPYKTHAACQFRHRLGKDAHAPGLYLHFDPDEVFFGGGLWLPPSAELLRVRQRIAERPQDWQAVLADDEFRRFYPRGVEGEQLQRPPKGFSKDSPQLEDLKRKSFYAMRGMSPEEALSIDLVTELLHSYRALTPLMQFLCRALDVPY